MCKTYRHDVPGFRILLHIERLLLDGVDGFILLLDQDTHLHNIKWA